MEEQGNTKPREGNRKQAKERSKKKTKNEDFLLISGRRRERELRRLAGSRSEDEDWREVEVTGKVTRKLANKHRLYLFNYI